MLHIVLYQPEIPPNTGNIIRLCANTGVHLHLIEPLGFNMDHQQLRRAGLDYAEFAEVKTYCDWSMFIDTVQPKRVLAMTTKGQRNVFDVCFSAGDAMVFGAESRGLPLAFLQDLPPEHWLRLPMQAHSRSLNLSNAVAVCVYEAWRQIGFGEWSSA